MQIISSSLESASNVFLHAGYISAYARELRSWAYDPVGVTDWNVAEALRLEGETLGDVPAAAALALQGDWVQMALATAVFFGTLQVVSMRRTEHLAPVVGLLCLSMAMCSHGSGPDNPPVTAKPLVGVPALVDETQRDEYPWKDLELEPYAHPEDATHVILHGLVADAIINSRGRLSSLADIEREVGLPTNDPTEGMAQAIRAYGVDGWGREMSLSSNGSHYTVRSAGADGVFLTEDDMFVTVEQCRNESWDASRHVFFLRPHEGSVAVFFHAYPGKHFRFNHRSEARELTGTHLFDYLGVGDLTDQRRVVAEKAYASISEGLAYEPLVMQRSAL